MDKNIYEDYAHEVLLEKDVIENTLSIAEVAKTLAESLGRTYHALALNIEGTIRTEGEEDISLEIIEAIGKVIKSGAYVLFLTRRRNTAYQILSQLKKAFPNPSPYYRQLHSIDRNGCRLFSLDLTGKLTEREIVKPIRDKINSEDYRKVLQGIYKELGEYFDIEEKTCGLRLIPKVSENSHDLSLSVNKWFLNKKDYNTKIGLKVAASNRKGKPIFDITHTDKDYALTWFYTEYDFIDVPILRIGSHGEENGNDYTLLDSPFGFSVGNLSSSPTKCFPIFHLDEKKLLKGVEGTCYLLNKLKWGRRLNIPSSQVYGLFHEYNNVCESLRKKAEISFSATFYTWSESAKKIFSNEVIRCCENANFSNVFDHKSGAIKLSDKEWALINGSEIGNFFAQRDSSYGPNKYESPLLIRSMYTNTGIILRGPKYYIGLSATNHSLQQAIDLLDENIKILNMIQELDLIQHIHLSFDSRFINWKLNLALLDNFRNSSLLLYNMLFRAAWLNTSSQQYWRRLLKNFESYVEASIDLYYSMLLIDEERCKSAMIRLNKTYGYLYDLRKNIELLYNFLQNNDVDRDKIIRKWREVDHPGQILVALKSIESDLSMLLKENSQVTVFGIMYGAIELPFALKSCYRGENEDNLRISEIMGISFYGQERGSSIMEKYSDEVLKSAIPNAERLEDVINEDDIAIILDDNIMTGRTIELARDRLLAYGAKVPFCVCVRFPHEHRIFQMEMRKHGGINPSALGSDVKGLVGQSPYSRIFTNAKGYKDATGVFDLSKERIIKYLNKNGLNIQDDL